MIPVYGVFALKDALGAVVDWLVVLQINHHP
jgi:ABC-type transporter lipoprotein component MlaA